MSLIFTDFSDGLGGGILPLVKRVKLGLHAVGVQ
jgi:hypothetical protein